jgi:hypothetical protein
LPRTKQEWDRAFFSSQCGMIESQFRNSSGKKTQILVNPREILYSFGQAGSDFND